MVSSLSSEDIIVFKRSPELEIRLTELLTKNKHDDLLDEERQELESFLQLNHFMNMLKIRARNATPSLP